MHQSITHSPFFPSSNPKLSNPTSPTSESTSESFIKKEEDVDNGTQQQQYDPNQIQSPSFSPEKDTNSSHSSQEEDFLQKFLQRRDYVIKKMAQFYQGIHDDKTRTIELRRLVFIKPPIHEAISVQNFLKNSNSDFFKFILKDLTNDIEVSLYCVQNLQDFCQAQQFLLQADIMIQTSNVIESRWQQIYRLPIYDPVLIQQVSRLEWIYRAMDVLSHNRADEKYPYVEHCVLLKKAANESQNKEMLESKFYKKIEEELQKFKSLTQKVTLLYEQERKQNLDLQKLDVQEVKDLLLGLKEFGFGMKQEIVYVEGMLGKTLKIEAVAERYLKFYHQKGLTSPNDLKKFLQQINNFPVRFPRIEEQVGKYFRNHKEQFQKIFEEAAQRIREGNLEMSQRFVAYAKNKTIRNGAMVPEAEEIWRSCGEEVQRIMQHSEKLIQDLPTFQFKDFGEIRRNLTKRGYEHIRAELWLVQMRALRIFSETVIKPSNPITFEELRSFLTEIKNYLNDLPEPKKGPFNEQIVFLVLLIKRIKESIKEERAKFIKNGKASSSFYTFIDITKEVKKYIHRQPVPWEQFKENQPPFIKSLNQKRNIGQIQEIDSYEKIEKKIKSVEVYQLVFPSSAGEGIQPKAQPTIIRIDKSGNIQNFIQQRSEIQPFEERAQPKSQPEIVRIEKPGNTPNSIDQRSEIQPFEEKKAQISISDWNQKNNNKENLDPHKKVNEKPMDTSEKMKKAEEYFDELNNEGLFDENFVFEDFETGKPDLERISYLDRLNEELWDDLDDGYKLKKKKKENLTNPAQKCNKDIFKIN